MFFLGDNEVNYLSAEFWDSHHISLFQRERRWVLEFLKLNARFETFFFPEAFSNVLIRSLLELLATSITIIGSTL